MNVHENSSKGEPISPDGDITVSCIFPRHILVCLLSLFNLPRMVIVANFFPTNQHHNNASKIPPHF